MLDFSDLNQKIYKYTEKKFRLSRYREFPTVRHVAIALKISQRDVVDECESNPFGQLMLTGYDMEDYNIGDLNVETLHKDV